MSCSRYLTALAFSFVLTTCSRPPEGPPPTFGVVRFENISGDPSLEWLSRAAGEVLPVSLNGALEGPVIAASSVNRLDTLRGGHPADTPGISGQRASLILSGAKRMITGYIEKSGAGVRIHAVDQDLTSGKTIRSFDAKGPATLDTILALARQFSPKAHPYLTSSSDALRDFSTALEVTPDQGLPLLERSIAADSSFGPAYIAAARLSAIQNRREAGIKLLQQAISNKLDPLSAATAKMDLAVLNNDSGGRMEALKEVIAVSPNDTSLLRQLAESKTAAGEYAEAAATWLRLSAILRDDIDVWNQLGYTRAWSGDYPGALAAMKEYARIRPNDANPSDSTGDIHFLYRKYSEAAASYLESMKKDPGMQAGASMYKAAWAKFYAGDRATGDKLMEDLKALREKAGVTNFHLFQADWLYRTGRTKEAVKLLRDEVLTLDSVDAQTACYEQLAVWALLEGNREQAAKDAQSIGQPKTPAGVLVRFAALPSASAAEWQKRTEQMFAPPQLRPIGRLALGYALLLDGKKQEALPIWQQLDATASPNDFFLKMVLPRLKGEKEKLAVLPNPNGVNHFAAVVEKL